MTDVPPDPYYSEGPRIDERQFCRGTLAGAGITILSGLLELAVRVNGIPIGWYIDQSRGLILATGSPASDAGDGRFKELGSFRQAKLVLNWVTGLPEIQFVAYAGRRESDSESKWYPDGYEVTIPDLNAFEPHTVMIVKPQWHIVSS